MKVETRVIFQPIHYEKFQPGEVEAQVEGTAESVRDPSEQGLEQMDTDDMVIYYSAILST